MLHKSENSARLKRRLLQEAVQENVDLVQGTWSRRTERKRRAWPIGFGVLALAPALLLLGTSRTPPNAAAVLAVGAPASVAASGREMRPAAAGLAQADQRLQQPSAIDPAVFPLPVRRVVVDAGHGGDNRGTVSPRGLVEKDLTLDIGCDSRCSCRKAGFEVILTRSGDESVSLARRTEIANNAQADAFVSIHVNWFSTRESRAVETYYLGPTEDPELNRLAAAENGESGYSLADFKHLLEGVYAGVRQEESRHFADVVDGALFHSLRAVNPTLADRGVKTAPFVVLVGTQMPAVLAEVSCLSNAEEAELLSSESYRQRIAVALYAGVRGFAEGPGRDRPAPNVRLAQKTGPQKGT